MTTRKDDSPPVKRMEEWTVVRREFRGKEGEPKVEMIWRVPTYGVLKKYGSAISASFLEELAALIR